MAGSSTARNAIILLATLGSLSCIAPRIAPLTGLPYTGALPRATLPPGHARLSFRWEYHDPLFSSKGDGVARVAPPDSVRIDFFVDGGMGGGGAVLIGDSLRTASDDGLRYLPPVSLLWGALGVLRVTGPDTAARIEGDTLRVQIGTDPSFRAAFADSDLVTLARIQGGRLREQVTRRSTLVEYRNPAAKRRLTLSDLRREPDAPFDPSIWHD